MNKKNIKTWERDGRLYAEWADRAVDDDDRYTHDTVFVEVNVPVTAGERALWSEMAQAYDQWVQDTRNGD